MKKSKLLAAVMASIALTGAYEEPDEEEPEVTEDVEEPQSVEQGESETAATDVAE